MSNVIVKENETLDNALRRFKRNFSPILDFELKTTSIYGLINNDRNLILEEYNNHLGGENNEK